MNSRIVKAVLATAMFGALGGCASSYATPGRGANLNQLSAESDTATSVRDKDTDVGLYPSLDKKPLAQLPTAIAVVRIQDSGYQTKTAQSWGSGKFSVVTTPDTEDPDLIKTWEKLPMVQGISPISRLLLPPDLNSEMDVRIAAAKLHADMLLIYTVDTIFYEKDQAAPLSVITLGLAPDHTTRVTSTVSAILVDTRNGYVYGAAEASDHDDSLTMGWTVDTALENARIRTETGRFKKLTPEIANMWDKVVKANTQTQAKAPF